DVVAQDRIRARRSHERFDGRVPTAKRIEQVRAHVDVDRTALRVLRREPVDLLAGHAQRAEATAGTPRLEGAARLESGRVEARVREVRAGRDRAPARVPGVARRLVAVEPRTHA